MELWLINGLMASALAFSLYITQGDRNYFCQKVWSKLWKR